MRMSSVRSLTVASLAALALCAVALVGAGSPASASAGPDASWHRGGGPLTAHTILAGGSLQHSFTVAGTSTVSSEPLSGPDDITLLGRDIFVGFQNGVGPQGQASPSGNLDSTVVEMTLRGQPVAQWDVVGKTDGVTADPRTHTVIATVNEDANSSLYAITPGPGGGCAALRLQRAAATRRRHRRHLRSSTGSSTSARPPPARRERCRRRSRPSPPSTR